MKRIVQKQKLITGYLEYLIKFYYDANESSNENQTVKIITPCDARRRGSQLSLMFSLSLENVQLQLEKRGVVVSCEFCAYLSILTRLNLFSLFIIEFFCSVTFVCQTWWEWLRSLFTHDLSMCFTLFNIWMEYLKRRNFNRQITELGLNSLKIIWILIWNYNLSKKSNKHGNQRAVWFEQFFLFLLLIIEKQIILKTIKIKRQIIDIFNHKLTLIEKRNTLPKCSLILQIKIDLN